MKSIKLNNLAKEILSNKEMNAVKGGVHCACTCPPESSQNGASSNFDGGRKDVICDYRVYMQ